MYTLSRHRLIFLSALLPFFGGLTLLRKGCEFLLLGPSLPFDSFQVAFAILFCALMIGRMKGRFVIAKLAKKNRDRILSLPTHPSLKNIYPPRFYLVIGVMMLLSLCIRMLHLSPAIHGAIDITIGSALLQGFWGNLVFSKP